MKDEHGEIWNAEVHTMNYWNDMSERVRNILAERPNVDSYANDELFSSWVRNVSPTARGVICNVRELRGAEFCSL
jgi:hypothetical protein